QAAQATAAETARAVNIGSTQRGSPPHSVSLSEVEHMVRGAEREMKNTASEG
ncbi:unnamed protein product, partial [Pylaiella littoralis]